MGMLRLTTYSSSLATVHTPHPYHAAHSLCRATQPPPPPPRVHQVGRIFHALQQEARKIRRGAAHSAHAARIERDAHVYLEWMLPRVDAALDLDALRTALRSSASTPALGAKTRQPSFCLSPPGGSAAGGGWPRSAA